MQTAYLSSGQIFIVQKILSNLKSGDRRVDNLRNIKHFRLDAKQEDSESLISRCIWFSGIHSLLRSSKQEV